MCHSQMDQSKLILNRLEMTTLANGNISRKDVLKHKNLLFYFIFCIEETNLSNSSLFGYSRLYNINYNRVISVN